MGSSCEHGNEPSNSIKDRNFLDHLSDCQVLKNDSGPWRKDFGILTAIICGIFTELLVTIWQVILLYFILRCDSFIQFN
jgi:hypothetical protein